MAPEFNFYGEMSILVLRLCMELLQVHAGVTFREFHPLADFDVVRLLVRPPTPPEVGQMTLIIFPEVSELLHVGAIEVVDGFTIREGKEDEIRVRGNHVESSQRDEPTDDRMGFRGSSRVEVAADRLELDTHNLGASVDPMLINLQK